MGLRDAVKEIDYFMAFVVMVIPPMIVGIKISFQSAFIGGCLGMFFVLYFVFLQWWLGPL